MTRRAIVIVIDGLGMGSVDGTFNTLGSISKHITGSVGRTLGSLCALAQGEYTHERTEARLVTHTYVGADSVAGHLEMLGAPFIRSPVFLSKSPQVINNLFPGEKFSTLAPGVFSARYPLFIANNIEAELGDTLNVLVDLDRVAWPAAVSLGKKLLIEAGCVRVIVMGQHGITQELVTNAISSRINPASNESVYGFIPAVAGAYGPAYAVQHITKSIRDINPGNVVSTASNAGIPVSLIGKVSDICSLSEFGVTNIQAVTTHETKQALHAAIDEHSQFIVANFQQVDLMGHARDGVRAAQELVAICESIDYVVEKLRDDDLLLVVADHGNDPSAQGNNHTTEQVPLIIHNPSSGSVLRSHPSGLRVVGALVASHLGLTLQ